MHLPGIKAAVFALNAITAPVCSPITCDPVLTPIAPVTFTLGLADELFNGLTSPFTSALGFEDGTATAPHRSRKHR